MINKTASKLLILLLLLIATIGCSNATNEPADTPTDTSTESDVSEAPAEETEDAAAEEVAEAPADTSGITELNILWAQWDPADFLQEIGNQYEAETGIKVNVIQEPWGSFGDLFFTEMAAQGESYDMVVGDSQWLGQGATQGHYMDMTDFMVSKGIDKTVTPATLAAYGEYPADSGTYWAYPTEGDADGWAYRMDLFEDPDEMAAFEAEYGYALAPPTDYNQLLDIAKFFTRPDEGLYGAAIYTQADYDALTMGIENTMFAWGADWQDENNNVMGVVNSDRAVEAIQFYRDLYDCCQAPGLSNAFFAEVNDAFIGGQVAMGMNYFAFFPALANPSVNPFAETTGYFVNPAGPYGDRGAALGGQGTSIVNYISDERKQASMDFLEWFAEEEVQAEWAQLGGYTCNVAVLESDEFVEIAPYNAAFAETMTIVKDFWNVPVFGELLQVVQTELGEFIVGGTGTAQEAMDSIAEQHDTILRDADLIKEGSAVPVVSEEAMADTSGITELNILWAQWDPADFLQEIGNQYEAVTGIKVNIIQEPWGSFGDLFFTEMAAQGESYDMVVGDSQWLGQGATQGHYMDMTDFLVGKGIDKTVTPATLAAYGEYPADSGTYWAYPTEGDADGWAYRMDLFEDPDEMAAFEAEYGYALAPPTDYNQLLDIAKFFTRPDEGLYGAAIYTQADYDALTMGIENTMFAWGADWQDENNNVMGVVNSDRAVEAIQFYRDLYDCCQAPGLSNAFFAEVNDAFIGGQVAMGMNYFAFFPALANPAVNPFAETTGYFVNPAGPYGDRGAALGGQGTSIVNYISDERKQASMDFLEWFAEEEVQAEWAALGGYTCNIAVLESDEFVEIAPYNAAFAETMTIVKDFWNVPVFGELLQVVQTELGEFIVGGTGTAQEAMDSIAEQHDAILRDADLISE